MAVLIAHEESCSCPLDDTEVEAICKAVLEQEGIGRELEVSVSFVDNEQIRALNREWRGIDAPTDVLSFECDDPFDESIPENEPLELGDVILAPKAIAAQAPRFDNTPAEEMRLMLVHGILHLLGFDHMNEADAAIMEQKELNVLQTLATQRGEDAAQVRIGPTTRHIDD